MITVIKETPITAFGRDCLEQLVHNDDMSAFIACDLCAYRGWVDTTETMCDCCTVHGCTTDPETYFQLSQL